MRIQFTIQQDDFTERIIYLRDFLCQISSYLQQGKKITIYIEDNMSTKITGVKLSNIL